MLSVIGAVLLGGAILGAIFVAPWLLLVVGGLIGYGILEQVYDDDGE